MPLTGAPGRRSALPEYSAVVPPTPVSRRRALLGGGAVLATGAAGGGVALYRSGRAEVPLYSETVAFAAPGVRELVPAGRLDAVVPGTRVLAARPHSGLPPRGRGPLARGLCSMGAPRARRG